jgi:2-polyprenyl-3-methyl-5-hydroxy-6-metoxy-1,4-benzoquinol methylase
MLLHFLSLASNEPLDALPQMGGDRRAYLARVLGALGVVPVLIERYGCYRVGKQLTGGSLMEQTNPYDEYAKGIASLDEAGVEGEPLGILPRMLDLLGNLDGLTILDAGCGEGYLSGVLASRSAKVTGIDVSPRLIQIAREKDPDGAIEYRVGDLSKPLPEYEEHFDAIASRLVLNDVYDYKGFIATLTSVLKPGGRLVVAMNNLLLRGSQAPERLLRLRQRVSLLGDGCGRHQGTLLPPNPRRVPRHLPGLRLVQLVDPPDVANNPRIETLLPEGYWLPFLMILAFEKS